MNRKYLPIFFSFVFALLLPQIAIAQESDSGNNNKTPSASAKSANADLKGNSATTSREMIQRNPNVSSAFSEEMKDQIQDAKQQIKETVTAQCQMNRERIQARLQLFNQNREQYVNSYNAIRENVVTISQSLESMGYDVDKLNKDLQTMDAMIIDYAKEYSSLTVEVGALADIPCDQPQGQQVRTQMQTMSKHMQQIRQMRMEIRTFYAQEVRQDLIDIRSQSPNG